MLRLLGRWLLGTCLISWRYLWMTTPLHREEHRVSSADDLPPALPPELSDEEVQLAGSGVGPLYHRRFIVHIDAAQCSARELMDMVVREFSTFVPREVIAISREQEGRLKVGHRFVVQMPGPWNGPVRVIQVEQHSLRLVTLDGHLEAGQIEFSAADTDEGLTFRIETWSRCASRAVWLLYAQLRLAKEIQFNMWVRFCLSAARRAGGRPHDGVRAITCEVPELALPREERNGGLRIGHETPTAPEVFPFRFAASYRPLAALFGITPRTAKVELTPDDMQIRFGPWRLRTSCANVGAIERSSDLSWPKTAGPARLSVVDKGITFATCGQRAVCLHFREPVSALLPTGRLKHPGATITVADPDAFISALRRRGGGSDQPG